MKKYLLLTLLLCSCYKIFPVNKIYPNLSCIQEDSTKYYFSGIGFKRKNEYLSLYKTASACTRDAGSVIFSGKFDPFIFHNQKSEGKTAFFQLTIINSNIPEMTLSEYGQVVEMFINKRIMEMKNNQNPRFQNAVQNKHDIVKTKIGLCQTLYEVVNDNKAKNLPKGSDYLVMQNIYKSCIIPSRNIIVDFALSIRTPLENAKAFDETYLSPKMDDIMKYFILESTGENLYVTLNT